MGGNAKTSLVVAVAHAEEHADESLQALQFGARAMRVVTRAVVNENTAASLLSAELLASLGNLEIQPCLVDASLLAKEEELGRIQEALQVRHRPKKSPLNPYISVGFLLLVLTKGSRDEDSGRLDDSFCPA